MLKIAVTQANAAITSAPPRVGHRGSEIAEGLATDGSTPVGAGVGATVCPSEGEAADFESAEGAG